MTEMPRQDLRRLRAMSLTHEIMRIVDDVFPEADNEQRREIIPRLEELFSNRGVELITDRMREDMRLPPRGPDGWTLDEIIALEQRRLEFLSRPVTVIAEK